MRARLLCRAETRERLTAGLQALGVSRLDAEGMLIDKRPNIPLSELTNGCVERLLAFIEQGIDDVRAHTGEPETTEEQGS
jgi:hypothetical protein